MSKSHAYYLLLTKQERDAIDFVGHRYAHGCELYMALLDATWRIATLATPHSETENIIQGYKVSEFIDAEWDGDYDIMFEMNESTAWEIKELIDEEMKSNKSLALFSESLQCKLLEFCERIV